MRVLRRLVVLLSGITAVVQAQTLEVIDGRGQVRTVTPAMLAPLPRLTVTASAHHAAGTFSGVSLAAVLRLAGTPAGDSLRGLALATYVLIEARDGYRALFALAELDAGFTDRVALLADTKDGAPLAEKDGPFQLIVPGEQRPARWVRQVRRIRVVQVPPAG